MRRVRADSKATASAPPRKIGARQSRARGVSAPRRAVDPAGGREDRRCASRPRTCPDSSTCGSTSSFNGGTKDELVLRLEGRQDDPQGRGLRHQQEPVPGEPRQAEDRHAAELRPAGAPVTLVVFSDFQCPVCKEEAQVLRQNLAKTFPDKVRVVLQGFPAGIDSHLGAPAAIAGRCVYQAESGGVLGLFRLGLRESGRRSAWTTSTASFRSSRRRRAGRHAARPLRRNQGDRSGSGSRDRPKGTLQVRATPTMFLNGRKLEGALPWQTSKR